MMAISIASCLAGAVCGDHCSPISDTTIMASAGGHCEHVNHVATQLPYVGFYNWCVAGCRADTVFTSGTSGLYCVVGCGSFCDSCKDRWKGRNLKQSLQAARLEFQEYGEGGNQEFPETDAAMEVIAASVSRLTN